jgi:hypothetical protein
MPDRKGLEMAETSKAADHKAAEKAGQAARDAEVAEAAKEAEPAKPEKERSALERAQDKAPHLDQEFVNKHELDDDYLERVARGEESPPPYNGPVYVTDLHRTDGGWQLTPKGVKPEDVGKDAISR